MVSGFGAMCYIIIYKGGNQSVLKPAQIRQHRILNKQIFFLKQLIMKPFEFSGIHHTAFGTSNMDKTIEYWRDLLGLKLAITFKGREGKQYAFTLPGGALIYFFEWPDVQKMPPKHHGQPVKGPFHFDHLALELNTLNELQRLQDQLAESLFPVSDMVDHGFIYAIYTFDPNGIPLEFNCRNHNFDFERQPVLADPDPSTITREGVDPVPGKWPEDIDDQFERVIFEGEDRHIFRP